MSNEERPGRSIPRPRKRLLARGSRKVRSKSQSLQEIASILLVVISRRRLNIDRWPSGRPLLSPRDRVAHRLNPDTIGSPKSSPEDRETLAAEAFAFSFCISGQISGSRFSRWRRPLEGRATSPRLPPLGCPVVSGGLELPSFGHAMDALAGIFQAVNCKSSVGYRIVSSKLTAVSSSFRSQGVSADPGECTRGVSFPLITVHRHWAAIGDHTRS